MIGEYIWNREVIPPGEQWRWATVAVRELGAASPRTRAEDRYRARALSAVVVNDIDTMVTFLDDVDLENVQANIDISHLVLSHVKPGKMRRLKGRAGHVHISDCDGQVHGDLPPGTRRSSRSVRVPEIKHLEIDGAISIELEFAPDPDRSSSGSKKPIRRPTSY